jgi:hypothetical protein
MLGYTEFSIFSVHEEQLAEQQAMVMAAVERLAEIEQFIKDMTHK